MDEKKVREAIERVKNFPEWNRDDLWLEMEDMEELTETILEALEKQLPKKPTYEGDGYAPDGTFVYDTWECPNCGECYEVDYDDYDYCPKCGQKIDWSENRRVEE